MNQKSVGQAARAGLDERRPAEWLTTIGVAIEIEGEEKPALAAEWLILSILEAGSRDVAVAPQRSRT